MKGNLAGRCVDAMLVTMKDNCAGRCADAMPAKEGYVSSGLACTGRALLIEVACTGRALPIKLALTGRALPTELACKGRALPIEPALPIGFACSGRALAIQLADTRALMLIWGKQEPQLCISLANTFVVALPAVKRC